MCTWIQFHNFSSSLHQLISAFRSFLGRWVQICYNFCLTNRLHRCLEEECYLLMCFCRDAIFMCIRRVHKSLISFALEKLQGSLHLPANHCLIILLSQLCFLLKVKCMKVAQLWWRDHTKLASFSINVQLYLQNHKIAFLSHQVLESSQSTS